MPNQVISVIQYIKAPRIEFAQWLHAFCHLEYLLSLMFYPTPCLSECLPGKWWWLFNVDLGTSYSIIIVIGILNMACMCKSFDERSILEGKHGLYLICLIRKLRKELFLFHHKQHDLQAVAMIYTLNWETKSRWAFQPSLQLPE